MSANISFLNGKAEAAFALQPAWWDVQNEYVLDHVPNSEEMIEAAHLDWEVEMQPIYDNDGRLIPGHATSIRTDTGLHLGVMSDQYRPIQNKTAFSFLDGLLKDGIMKYESAGALRGGRTVWALARMPSVDQIAEGDELNRYVLWLNSHDATGALYAIPTSVRVVCSNTAALAIKNQKGIRHIGDLENRLKATHKLLSQADKAFTDHCENARLLAARRYTKEQANEYVDTLVPMPETEGRASTIRERKVQAIRDAFASERNQLPSIRGTWWSLYNSVSEAVDHGRFYAFKGSGRTRAENRLQSVVINGPGVDLKQKAFDLALSMAT